MIKRSRAMEGWTKEENEKLNEFLVACDEMITGKFILSDTKVAKILKCIATSSHLYQLFGQCLVGFNFKQELQSATKDGFVMPESKEKVVAFVFCFLLEIDNKHISLQNFVNDHFYHKEGYNRSYQNFALTVLVPFKENVLALLSGEETEENEEIVPQEEPIYQNLRYLLASLRENVRQSRRMKNIESVEMVIDAMMEAINLKNWKIINGLLISLDLLLEKEKTVASTYNQIKETVFHYYYS